MPDVTTLFQIQRSEDEIPSSDLLIPTQWGAPIQRRASERFGGPIVSISYTRLYPGLEGNLLETDPVPLMPIIWEGITENVHVHLLHLRGWLEPFDEMLKMEDGWDDEDAIAPEKDLVGAAFSFLMRYAHHIYTELEYTVLPRPDISLRPDGTIDFLWETPNGGGLLNFRRSGKGVVQVHYYGEVFGEREPQKGILKKADIVRHHFAAWLANFRNYEASSVQAKEHPGWRGYLSRGPH